MSGEDTYPQTPSLTLLPSLTWAQQADVFYVSVGEEKQRGLVSNTGRRSEQESSSRREKCGKMRCGPKEEGLNRKERQ